MIDWKNIAARLRDLPGWEERDDLEKVAQLCEREEHVQELLNVISDLGLDHDAYVQVHVKRVKDLTPK